LQLQVRDDRGAPTVAAFTIRDGAGSLYPHPSKRLAPDLFFQPQVYRADGETVLLPEGTYTISCSLGPEYHAQTKQVTITATGANEVSFALQRWIDPPKYGWYSGDHHVHAAGCSHYQNPTEGVRPEDMVRQIQGEKLNVGAVLTWGPCYYYQKQFFSARARSGAWRRSISAGPRRLRRLRRPNSRPHKQPTIMRARCIRG
jgi:hypothetical protein